jgi:hypothetical protein
LLKLPFLLPLTAFALRFSARCCATAAGTRPACRGDIWISPPFRSSFGEEEGEEEEGGGGGSDSVHPLSDLLMSLMLLPWICGRALFAVRAAAEGWEGYFAGVCSCVCLCVSPFVSLFVCCSSQKLHILHCTASHCTAHTALQPHCTAPTLGLPHDIFVGDVRRSFSAPPAAANSAFACRASAVRWLLLSNVSVASVIPSASRAQVVTILPLLLSCSCSPFDE